MAFECFKLNKEAPVPFKTAGFLLVYFHLLTTFCTLSASCCKKKEEVECEVKGSRKCWVPKTVFGQKRKIALQLFLLFFLVFQSRWCLTSLCTSATTPTSSKATTPYERTAIPPPCCTPRVWPKSRTHSPSCYSPSRVACAARCWRTRRARRRKSAANAH